MSKEQQLYEISTEQWGLVTTAQGGKIGITPQTMAKMTKAGDLIRLAHGIYRLAGMPIDMHEDLRVAWLGLDPGRTAVERIAAKDVDIVSHKSAALLFGLGDLDADIMEFTVARRRQTRRTDIRLHRVGISVDDWALIAGLPTAAPLRIITDLAAARIDRGHLATVVRDAVLNHNLATSTVSTALARHTRAYGVETGDGQGLVALLLREAGVPRSAIDIVARGASDDPAMRLLRDTMVAEIGQAVARQVMSSLFQDGPLGFACRPDPEVLRAIAAITEPAVEAAHRVVTTSFSPSPSLLPDAGVEPTTACGSVTSPDDAQQAGL